MHSINNPIISTRSAYPILHTYSTSEAKHHQLGEKNRKAIDSKKYICKTKKKKKESIERHKRFNISNKFLKPQ